MVFDRTRLSELDALSNHRDWVQCYIRAHLFDNNVITITNKPGLKPY